MGSKKLAKQPMGRKSKAPKRKPTKKKAAPRKRKALGEKGKLVIGTSDGPIATEEQLEHAVEAASDGTFDDEDPRSHADDEIDAFADSDDQDDGYF